MYDICHPSYYYIGKLGCKDPVKISTAFYVYIELCEVKRFWDVKYKYNESLDLLFFEVKQRRQSELEIYVPWPTIYNITLDLIEKIQQELKIERITFVFKSEDTSSVSYRVSAGLVKPLAPEVTKRLREKEEKRMCLEKEIRRNTCNLYELAKSAAENDANVEPSTSTNSEETSVDEITQ
ncbi:hypothetical protein KM043_016700 [Ampulex compressa]|nr:hypothetical protein KM043_016700 [Ampulex compressa]